MAYLITELDYDTLESFGNEEYKTVLGYVDTEEEAKIFIENRRKNASTKHYFGRTYPSFSMQEIKKLS